jgi:hypothetical protein
VATRRKVPPRIRRQVIERAKGRCEYCQSPEEFSLDAFAVDHIQALAACGTDDLANLAFACQNCNNRKQDDSSALDPATGHKALLYHPRRDRWDEHFRWSADGLTIIPLTATGRATVARLQLNRRGAVNLRCALLALGEEHPPASTACD